MSVRPRSLVAALIGAIFSAPSLQSPPTPRSSALPPRGKGRGVSSPKHRLFMRQLARLPHQGSAEIARRRAQIERGQLTGSNGLVVPQRAGADA